MLNGLPSPVSGGARGGRGAGQPVSKGRLARPGVRASGESAPPNDPCGDEAASTSPSGPQSEPGPPLAALSPAPSSEVDWARPAFSGAKLGLASPTQSAPTVPLIAAGPRDGPVKGWPPAALTAPACSSRSSANRTR